MRPLILSLILSVVSSASSQALHLRRRAPGIFIQTLRADDSGGKNKRDIV
jgi:hypothetical protein